MTSQLCSLCSPSLEQECVPHLILLDPSQSSRPNHELCYSLVFYLPTGCTSWQRDSPKNLSWQDFNNLTSSVASTTSSCEYKKQMLPLTESSVCTYSDHISVPAISYSDILAIPACLHTSSGPIGFLFSWQNGKRIGSWNLCGTNALATAIEHSVLLLDLTELHAALAYRVCSFLTLQCQNHSKLTQDSKYLYFNQFMPLNSNHFITLSFTAHSSFAHKLALIVLSPVR